MAIERNCERVIPAYDESSYEERASVEEIYLEETEEELRARLISDTPADDPPSTAPDIGFELYRALLANLFEE